MYVIKVKYSFQQTEETALMLGHNIVYIANWLFGLDYTSIATNTLQEVIRFYPGKKLNIMQYLSSSNYVPFSPCDRRQIGIKLGTKHVIH